MKLSLSGFTLQTHSPIDALQLQRQADDIFYYSQRDFSCMPSKKIAKDAFRREGWDHMAEALFHIGIGQGSLHEEEHSIRKHEMLNYLFYLIHLIQN